MDQCMNALADKVQKQNAMHTVICMHSITCIIQQSCIPIVPIATGMPLLLMYIGRVVEIEM